jgi:hypothetical protein
MKVLDSHRLGAAIACVSECIGMAQLVEHTDTTARQAIAFFKSQAKAQGVNFNVNTEGQHLGSGVAKQAYEPVIRNLKGAEAHLADAPLPSRLYEKLRMIRESVERDGPNDFKHAIVQARLLDFSVDLIMELQEPKFLCIAPEHRELFEQKEPPFGQPVADKFPDSARDVSAAARCLALDEWTASVGHLVRALEPPLQIFAKKIGVEFPAPTDLENWKSIVDQMEKKIAAEEKRLEQTTKSHERNQELQLLGDVALDFRHFKNAWRNDVAHGREWYDPREAQRVYDAVKHFMQRMAEIA